MRTKIVLFLLCFVMGAVINAKAQNVGINSTGAAPHASAGLDVSFTNKGFLAPRMTTAQRTAIASPATGLLVYQTDGIMGFYYYNGSGWSYLTTSGTSSWALIGNTGLTNTYNSGSFIGNTDANALRFRTNNLNRFMIDASGNAAIGANPTFAANAEKLLVDAGTTTSYNLISGKGSYNNYLQLNIQNTSNGNSASSDVVASNNAATESANFVDMGINSSGNTSTGVLGGANTAYLYSTGNDFSIGNAKSGKDLKFFTNGTADTDERMRITSTGLVGIGTGTAAPTERLDVSGKALIGTAGTTGRVKVSNTESTGVADISTDDDTMLRISNSGTGQTGSSLQLKNSSENYLFSFEGRGGFRYYSRTANNMGEKFRVNDGGDIYLTTEDQNTAVDARGNINDFYQLNVMNESDGTNASSDVVATADNGDDADAYIDMGINSSGYNNSTNGVSTILNGPNTTYLYGNGENMLIGNAARNKPLIFFTNSSTQDGGTDARGTERMRINPSGEIQINTVSDLGNYKLQVSGNIMLDGTLYYDNAQQNSDIRLKTNISPMNFGLKDIVKLRPVTYNWKKTPDTDLQLGLIAQELREVIPEVVKGDESKETLSVNYTALIPVLINAIKELKEEINKQGHELNTLKAINQKSLSSAK